MSKGLPKASDSLPAETGLGSAFIQVDVKNRTPEEKSSC